MYCYIVFGKSDDNHTKKYLYQCGELMPGDTVIVTVKNFQKIALVHSLLKEIPEELGVKENDIQKIVGLNTNVIERKNVISFILAMIDEYKDGNISKEIFYCVVEHFASANKLDITEKSELQSIIWLQLPDVCTFYIDEPGNASDKELNFWKGIKDIEYRLRYGRSFWEKDDWSMRIKTDPLEFSDEYLKIELELERLIREEIGEGGYMGFCHKYWRTKKNILRNKYGREWKSPVDLNPEVNFD